MTVSLLTTKLFIPPVRPNRVTRPHLLERLDASLRPDCRLVLLSAPAGFGKTTLLSEWITMRQEVAQSRQEVAQRHHEAGESPLEATRFCWLSLDEGDNDPARFLRYLVNALRTAHPELGGAALALLQAPVGAEGMVSMEGILNALLNDLAAQSTTAHLFLVLDDYHQIDAPDVHSALGYLIEHLPPRVHVVMATRSDPPLPFSRLRARDQVSELRVADLRFTSAEAAAFLNDVMRLNLSAEDVAALEARTEGWIAGLQLASLAARSAQDRSSRDPSVGHPSADDRSARDRSSISSFVSDFAGSNRYILDYLVDEVLAHQLPAVQEFLLQTSVLERFCGELCEEVISQTGRNQSGREGTASSLITDRLPTDQLIDHLERANLFIVPLDSERRWYRYHNLFAEFLYNRLYSRLEQETPGRGQVRVREMYSKASAWFERQNLAPEAIEYALRAEDYPRAADLIERKMRWVVLIPGETGKMLRWLEAIPEEVTVKHPGLCLTQAWVLLSAGHTPDAEPYVDAALRSANAPNSATAPRGSQAQPAGYDWDAIRSEAAAIRSLLAVMAGRLDDAIDLARSALEHLPEDAALLRSMVVLNLGLAYDMRGDPAAATPVYRQAVELSQAAGNLLVTMIAAVQLADLELLQGRLGQAEASYRQAVQLAGQLGGVPVTGMAYSGLGHILYEQNRLEEAAQQLEKSIQVGQAWESKDLLAISQVYLAQVRLVQGRPDEALALAAQAEESLHGSLSSSSTVYSTRAFITRVWLRAGQMEPAARWARAYQEQPEPFPQAYLRVMEGATLARVCLALGQPAQAAEIAARLLANAQSGEVIELKTLQALALAAQGQTGAAIQTLSEALAQAEPAGYARLFLDEGAPMAHLLRLALARGASPAYTRTLLDAFEPGVLQEAGAPPTSSQANSALIEPLSQRELDVLRLAAQGLSNQVIAERLVVAVSTVKTHINNIYGKLGVQTRIQAVTKARELRLLD